MTTILQPGKLTSLGVIPEMKSNVQLKWKMSHDVRVQLIDKASSETMWLALQQRACTDAARTERKIIDQSSSLCCWLL